MFRLFCKSVRNGRTQDSTSRHVFSLLETQSRKFYSNSTNQHSPTVSYLIIKCGLSLESAILASQKIKITKTEKSDSVLELFRAYEFTPSQIAGIITKWPPLIRCDPVKVLKPKFEFFESLGMSKRNIAEMVLSNNHIVRRSLTNNIIPAVNLLKRFFHTNGAIIRTFRSGWRWAGVSSPFPDTEPNILVLRQLGVSEPHISKLLLLSHKAIMQNHDHFKETVRAIVGMRIDPESLLFISAFAKMSKMSKPCWERKIEVFKSFGWSEEDAISAFKLQPNCMTISEKKITTLLKFYSTDLGLSAFGINKYPNLLLVSLEKRIVPRCSVLLYLLSNCFITKKLNLMSVLNCEKKIFENNYVTKYQGIAPEVLKAYQGKLGYPDLEALRAILGCVN